MKHLFIFFLLLSSAAYAQLSDKQLKEMHDNAAKIESTSAKLNESINASMLVTDSLDMVRFNEQNTRNLNAFMAERKEQERKATQRMYWRLGFGVLMLAVLIVGWRRKKQVKS